MKFRSVLVLAGICAATAAHAVDPSLFQDLQWRSIGPQRGGRVLAVTGVPGQPARFYFGAVNGGVWQTDDAGRTWRPIFDAQPIGAIGAIAVAPSDPNVLYVGTGEADMRSDISQGAGVYKSTDAGKTWTFAGLRDTQQIAKILVDPKNAGTAFVAALGHPYGPNAERGVFRTQDGGAHWQKVLGSNDDTGAVDLAFEPGNPQTIYAALWQTRRPPWSIYPPSSGPGSGVYKSTDGGIHWTPLAGHGLPEHVGRVGLALSDAAPHRVYAIVDGDEGGLYRSDDAGATWVRKSSDHRIWQRAWYFGEIAADPKNAERVYAMNTIVLRSDDGGANWIALKGDNTGDDFHALWIDPQAPERQILGVDQGAIVTLNGGRTWSSWHNQPTAQIYHVSTDNRFPYWVYGAQQDSGAVSVPSRGDSRNGIGMTQFRELAAGGESDNIVPDPDNPQHIFGGRVDEYDLDTQAVRNIDPTLSTPDLYRATWTLPLVFAPRAPHALYFGNQRVYRTRDRGAHWDAISPDLTRENPAVPKTLDAATAADDQGRGPRKGVVFAIAPSPTADGVLWAGTDDGLIWRTSDDGAHWQNVTPAALGDWSKVATIEASPFDADSAYAAIDRHRLDDFHPHILRTHDAGKTWSAIVKGIPDDQAVNVVRADPARKGLLYAGTERSVYVSFDDGASWQSLKQNLPPTSVRDITVHDPDIVIATHGRGFWILDDVAPLRQAQASVPKSGVWLFAPSPAVRQRRPDFLGTPLPKDEPVAANPPDGAYFDYWLKAEANAPLTLEIHDAQGALVRSYSSADAQPPVDPAKLDIAPEWVRHKSALSLAPGMHRFVWPLRYATADDAHADGVWAPPGEYSVTLRAGGKTRTQNFSVRPDPRIVLAPAVYAQQFELARRIETLRGPIKSAGDGAGKLLEQVAERRHGADPAVAAALDAYADHLRALTGTRASANPHNAWAYPPAHTETLRLVGEWLDKLQQAVDGVDAEPSPDARRGIDAVAALVDVCTAKWKTLSGAELEALNVQLASHGAKPLSLKTESKAEKP